MLTSCFRRSVADQNLFLHSSQHLEILQNAVLLFLWPIHRRSFKCRQPVKVKKGTTQTPLELLWTFGPSSRIWLATHITWFLELL